jgi:hypothetical protein
MEFTAVAIVTSSGNIFTAVGSAIRSDVYRDRCSPVLRQHFIGPRTENRDCTYCMWYLEAFCSQAACEKHAVVWSVCKRVICVAVVIDRDSMPDDVATVYISILRRFLLTVG